MRLPARWILPLLPLLALAGCRGCRGEGAAGTADGGGRPDAASSAARKAPDAGPARASGAGLDGGRGSLPVTDIRTALFLVHPEWRGATITGRRFGLRRYYPAGLDWDESGIEPQLREAGFTVKDGGEGTVVARRERFAVLFRPDGADDRTLLELSLPLTEEVNKLAYARAPLGSERLSRLLPRAQGVEAQREEFFLELTYDATPQRAAALVRFLIGSLLRSHWTPDAPLGPELLEEADAGSFVLPERSSAQLRSEATGGELGITRVRGKVSLDYRQPLTPPH